jgi:hypothetical protein
MRLPPSLGDCPTDEQKSSGVTRAMEKLIAWVSLPLLPMLGAFALLWLYVTEDDDHPKSHPYSL